MASGFKDISLKPSGKATLKLPKKFGASEARGTIVELKTNNVPEKKIFFWNCLIRKIRQNISLRRLLKIILGMLIKVYMMVQYFTVQFQVLFFRVVVFQRLSSQVAVGVCLRKLMILERLKTSLEIQMSKVLSQWQSWEVSRIVLPISGLSI